MRRYSAASMLNRCDLRSRLLAWIARAESKSLEEWAGLGIRGRDPIAGAQQIGVPSGATEWSAGGGEGAAGDSAVQIERMRKCMQPSVYERDYGSLDEIVLAGDEQKQAS